jgi:hypothetical protein
MRTTVSRIVLLVCALFAVVPATAGAATAPKVTSVAPLKLKIGDRLTVRGKGFLPGKNRNTVVFKANGARAVFAKAQSATTTKLVVKVPVKLAPFLKVSAGQATATRFQLRVLAKKLSPSYTPAGKSPVIAPAVATAPGTGTKPVAKAPASGAAAAAAAVPAAVAPSAPAAPVVADCDRDGIADSVDPDDDNDLLPDVNEVAIGTGTCDVDSDGDGMEDGWEYQSALQLNNRSCPDSTNDYPTPCPALPDPKKNRQTDPTTPDANIDYDGDWLTAGEEHAAWQYKIKQDPSYHALTGPKGMWYSDGKQSSVDTSPAGDGCRGLVPPLPFDGAMARIEFKREDGSFPALLDNNGDVKAEYEEYTLDRDHNGCLDDGERDEDHDFLTNVEETTGELSSGTYWTSIYGDAPFRNTYRGTNFLDQDSDGDDTVDGLDDQDFDDFLNVEEIRRGPVVVDRNGTYVGDMSGLWVNPFNPCEPSWKSRTCPTHIPVSDVWSPFPSGGTPGGPRWALYGTPLYGLGTPYPIKYPQPGWTADPAHPEITQPPLIDRPAEIWDGMPRVDQTMPPEHPLPRP